MSTGAYIKEKREEQGLTQAELADRIGYDRSLIAHIERGTKIVTLPQAAAIAAALGTTIDALASA